MRVALIGSSHVGALAVAFRQQSDADALPWDFYAVPNGYANRAGLSALSLDLPARQLTGFPSPDPQKPRSLPIDAYDAFFLIGAQPSALNYARLFEPRFSARFTTAALDDMFHNSRAFQLFQKIRKASDAPIYTACEYAYLRNAQTLPKATDQAEAAMTAFWQEHGVKLLPQPAELLDENGLTRTEHFLSDLDFHLTPDSAAYVIAQFRQVLGV